MTKKSSSLTDFASANPRPRGRTCRVCQLAEREEIDGARKAGSITVPQMIGWLATRGVTDVTRSNLNYHFQAGHDG